MINLVKELELLQESLTRQDKIDKEGVAKQHARYYLLLRKSTINRINDLTKEE